MTDDTFGSRTCYICQAGLDPLTSTCPYCGYSQLPKPGAESTGSQSAESKLKSEIEKAKADLRAGIKKKK